MIASKKLSKIISETCANWSQFSAVSDIWGLAGWLPYAATQYVGCITALDTLVHQHCKVLIKVAWVGMGISLLSLYISKIQLYLWWSTKCPKVIPHTYLGRYFHILSSISLSLWTHVTKWRMMLYLTTQNITKHCCVHIAFFNNRLCQYR